MRFVETGLSGAWLIEPDLISDERGFSARTYYRNEFPAKGFNPNLVQCNHNWCLPRSDDHDKKVQISIKMESELCDQFMAIDPARIKLNHRSC